MSIIKHVVFLAVLTFLSVGAALPATTTSTASGNWSNAAIWSNGVPSNNDNVIIATGDTVTLNVNSAAIRGLTIRTGAFLFGDGTGKLLLIGNAAGEDFTNNGVLLARDAQALTVILNKNSQWGGIGIFRLGLLNLNTHTLSFSVGSSFTVRLNAAPDPILNPGGINSSQNVVFQFDGTSPQNLSSSFNVHYGNLTIDNPAGVTLKSNLSAVTLDGALALTAGSLLTTQDGSAAYSISGSVTNSVTLGANSILRLGCSVAAPSTFPVGFVTFNFHETSTVDYVNNSTATQVISPNPVYGNIQFHGTGPKSLQNGTVTLNGNWLNDATGALSVSLLNTVVFNSAASSAKTIGGTTPTSFQNLTIANASGVSLNNATTVNGTLGLGNSTISTGANILTVGPSGSVSRATGYVNGYLQKSAPAGPSNLTFEVGDATSYAPVDVAFAFVTTGGGLVVHTTAGAHPNIGTSHIDPSKDANRYWTLTGAGVGFSSYDVTLHYANGDVDSGANRLNFGVNQYSSSAWTTPTTGARTATSTEARGLTSFGDLVVGELQTFIIDAIAGVNGSITPNGSVTVEGGTNQSFLVTPAVGYHTDSVLVDGVDQGPVGGYTFTNVTAAHSIRSVFAIDTFTITATGGLHGVISPTGSIGATYGSNQSFTITPDTGYHVDSVLVDGVDQGLVGTYTFTNVTANHTIRTVYAIDQFVILAASGPNGTISPNGPIPATYGSDQSFTIIAGPNYHIDSVLVDGVDQGRVGSYSFTNVSANHTIRAVFAIDHFAITASAGVNGSISPSGSIDLSFGDSQSFTITPNTGYHVDSVLVDGVDQGPVGSYTFTNVTANHTIQAAFAINQYTITSSAGANGSLSPNGSISATHGSDHGFTITANTGYHIDSVVVDGVDQGPVGSYTFTNVVAGHTIHATFAIDQFTISAVSGPGGSISPNGSISANYGSDYGFTITPAPGYHIADVHVDSVSVGAVVSYTFTNVTANHSIDAAFAIDQFTITASAGVNGSISPNGPISADYATDHVFSITPNTGYHIDSLLVDDVSQPPVGSYTFTNVVANHTIHASFAIDEFTLAASDGPNGSISPTGSIVATYGSDHSFTIMADPGYHVADVHVDSISVGAVASYTFLNVTSNHTIHATFAIDHFTIASSAGANGLISPSGSISADYGSDQSFTMTADPGYHVADLHVDSISVGAVASYTFSNVTANHTIHATFALDQFIIAAAAGLHGSISPNGLISATYGSDHTFTITPDVGYHIADVHVDSVSVGAVAGYSFTNVSASHTIYAIFAIDEFTIFATAGSNGSISPSGSIAATYGSNHAFTITPDSGYYIADVHADSVSVGAVSGYAFTNVTSNHTISAEFMQILNPAPRLFSLSPSNAYRGDTLDVTYHGRNFINGVTFMPVRGDIGSGGFTILSDSVLVHHIVITANASLGAHGFFVENIPPGGGFSDTVAFTVLNRAPMAARLMSPANDDNIVIDTLSSPIIFVWRASADPDAADTLTYALHITGPGVDSVLTNIADTTVQLANVSILQLGKYRWTVDVTDGHIVTASTDTFSLNVVTGPLAVNNRAKGLPTEFALHQNFPNPFNPTTNVRFDLPKAADVKIVVYNIIGQAVATLADQASMTAGYHEVTMDAGGLPSGMYFYRITATEEGGKTFVNVKKMMLVK